MFLVCSYVVFIVPLFGIYVVSIRFLSCFYCFHYASILSLPCSYVAPIMFLFIIVLCSCFGFILFLLCYYVVSIVLLCCVYVVFIMFLFSLCSGDCSCVVLFLVCSYVVSIMHLFGFYVVSILFRSCF